MTSLPAALLAAETFTVADAERVGVGARSLQRAVRSGDLVRLRRGWYTRPGADAGRSAHYLARCRSAAAQVGLPLAGPSAAVAHGLPVWALARRPVHLAGPPARRRSRRELKVITWDTDERTALDLCDTLLTTALVDPCLGVACADAALRRRAVSADRLSAQLHRLDGRRGGGAARKALEVADARRESPGESWLAWLLLAWGIDVDPQVPVDVGGRTVRPDFLVRGTRVVVEFDGMLKYAHPDDLAAEKRREDELRRLGYTVVRVVWADLHRPELLRRRVLDAIALDARVA